MLLKTAILFSMFLAGGTVWGAPADLAPDSAVSRRKFIDQYCIACHNQKAKAAGLMLDRMDVNRVPEDAEVWEKVIRKVRGGMMPPPGMRRPDPASVDAFAGSLESTIDRAARSAANPGYV